MKVYWHKYDRPALSIGIYRYASMIRLWKIGLSISYKSNMKFHIRIGWFNQIKMLEPEPFNDLLPDFIIDPTDYSQL